VSFNNPPFIIILQWPPATCNTLTGEVRGGGGGTRKRVILRQGERGEMGGSELEQRGKELRFGKGGWDRVERIKSRDEGTPNYPFLALHV
jgi:hypothetical protein